MKKRILSIVLVICMLLVLAPTTTMAASVTELKQKDVSNGTLSFSGGKTYRLAEDITINSRIWISGNTGEITLDLNGHVLKYDSSYTTLSMIDLEVGNTLTLEDSNPTAVHKFTPDDTGLWVLDEENGTKTVMGGVITGGDISGQYGSITAGAAIGIEGGNARFIMKGGNIVGCKAGYGGAVGCQHGGAYFDMEGGSIVGCTATGSDSFGGGSAVSLSAYSHMTISGKAIISDCPGISTIWCAGNIYAHGGTINGDIFLGATGNQYETIEGVGLITKKDDYTGSASTTFNGYIDNWGATITYGTFNGEVSNVEVCRSTMKIKGGNFKGSVTGYGPIYGGIFYDSVDDTLDIADDTKKITFMDDDKCYAFEIVANGSNAVSPIKPTRDGDKFLGWYNGDTKYDFTQPITKDITLTAKWVLSNVSTEAGLTEAINAGITSIKLIGDITLSSTLDLSDKNFILDLNGHILTGNIKLADSINPTNPSKLTLTDSNPTATHTDSTLPLGGVLDGEILVDKKTFGSASLLCANGGTVTGQVNLNDSAAQIGCTSNTPTAFMGYVGGSGEIHGGMFYGNIKESCIEEKAVTFINDGKRYAVCVVAGSNKAVAPIAPEKDGYVFAGWYIGNTKYDFAQTVISDITLTAKWVSAVNTEENLRTAINEGVNPIKLMSDIKLSSTLDLSQKTITIDLNGYVISGADISINTGNGKANLTLIDSRPTATHTDSTLPSGGVVTSKISMKQSGGNYNDCVLYANGGTVTSEFNTNTNAVAVKCTSDTPTAFTGKISGHAHLYGGIYYGTIASPVTIERNKITFKNGDDTYAYEIVDSGRNTVAPISPVREGYQTFDGWYDGDTAYTFGSGLGEDITLTAKFSNPITYNIFYNIDGGTANNPTSYNVESDTITLNNPTKTGYTFAGWSGTGLTGNNNKSVTIPKGSTGERTYTAHWNDVTVPVISGIEKYKT